MRTFVANLDAELTWCLEATGKRAAPPGLKVGVDPRRLLPRALLCAFLVDPGGRLILPAGMDPEAARFEGPLAERDIEVLVAGRVEVAESEEVVPWARTQAWATEGRAEAARGLNDRTRWADRDPGRRRAVVRSLPELEEDLHRRDRGDDQAWVVKAAWSGAGRLRLRGTGPELDAAGKDRAERLLTLAGALVVENWTKDLEEWGVVLQVEDPLPRLIGMHRLQGQAGPASLVRDGGDGEPPTAAWKHPAFALGMALHAEGYRGPVGVDLRRGPGLHESSFGLGDVNVRYTFGHVLHASGFGALQFGGPQPMGDATLLISSLSHPDESIWGITSARDPASE